jgi:GntR family transcriptional repressor for pyruvate dehydrogenase complex
MVVKTPDVIVKHLVNAIGRGELGPGDRLPTLGQLASATSTSVLSVREAISSLAAIGLVEVRHGKGVFLTRGAPIVEDLLEARRALESAFALRAAEGRSGDLVRRLDVLVEEMDRHCRGGD